MNKVKVGPNRTRAGRDVVVLMTNAKGRYPVIGIIKNKDCDDPAAWTIDGKFNDEKEETSTDLMVFANNCEGEK